MHRGTRKERSPHGEIHVSRCIDDVVRCYDTLIPLKVGLLEVMESALVPKSVHDYSYHELTVYRNASAMGDARWLRHRVV